MDRLVQRGEIWMYEFKPPDKRRPVLILSSQMVIHMLNYVIVAPITSTIHGSPIEVVIGIDQGLKNASAINLTGVQSVEKSKRKSQDEDLGTKRAKRKRNLSD